MPFPLFCLFGAFFCFGFRCVCSGSEGAWPHAAGLRHLKRLRDLFMCRTELDQTGLVQVAGYISVPFLHLELAKVCPKHKNNERPERERPE